MRCEIKCWDLEDLFSNPTRQLRPHYDKYAHTLNRIKAFFSFLYWIVVIILHFVIIL